MIAVILVLILSALSLAVQGRRNREAPTRFFATPVAATLDALRESRYARRRLNRGRTVPLALTFKATEDFFVGARQFRVTRIHTGSLAACTVRDEQTGATFDIDQEQAVAILPDVWVSAGLRRSPFVVSLAFIVPDALAVLRGRKYRALMPAHR